MILTGITADLAATAFKTGSILSLAIAATVMEVVSVLALLLASLLFLRRLSRPSFLLAWFPGVAFCFVGTTLVMATLATTIHVKPEDEGDASSARVRAGAGLAIVLMGLIPHTAFWALTWPRKQRRCSIPTKPTSPKRFSPTSSSKKRSLSVHLAAMGSRAPKLLLGHRTPEPTSPSCSFFSTATSPRSSLRNSAISALRPITSKTRLLLHTSLHSQDARSFHSRTEPAITVDGKRSNDEFENWDTSKVDEIFENPFRQKTRLETIPGSRPASPAHPLNGPFPSDGMSEVPPRSASPTLSRLLPRRLSVTSSNADQSHIHPLFRTESPIPPPLASPRTVITASPYAGQVVSPEFALTSPRLLGSREGSRAASPSLLSPPRSRPGSVKSYRVTPSSPIDSQGEPLPDRSVSQLSQAHMPPKGPPSPNG